MYKYVFRRIYQLIIVFFLFLVTSYVLFDSIPGNAFQSLLLTFDKRENKADPITIAVRSVSVVAPSSSERPLAKEISKSFTSKENLF